MILIHQTNNMFFVENVITTAFKNTKLIQMSGQRISILHRSVTQGTQGTQAWHQAEAMHVDSNKRYGIIEAPE